MCVESSTSQLRGVLTPIMEMVGGEIFEDGGKLYVVVRHELRGGEEVPICQAFATATAEGHFVKLSAEPSQYNPCANVALLVR